MMGDQVWNWRMLRAGGAQLGPQCWAIKNLGTKWKKWPFLGRCTPYGMKLGGQVILWSIKKKTNKKRNPIINTKIQ